MKKMHLILGLVTSLLATPVWAEPIDINTADADTLAEVMLVVGSTLATAIVDYRAASDVFESVCELVKVKGIGVALIEKNRDSITVDTGSDSDC